MTDGNLSIWAAARSGNIYSGQELVKLAAPRLIYAMQLENIIIYALRQR